MSTSEDAVIPRRLIRNLLWDRAYPLTLRATINKLHDSASLLEPALYRSEEVNEILKKYPEYRKTYDHFPRKIMKADMARLLILYDQGGWYFDLDIKPAENSLNDFIHIYEKMMSWCLSKGGFAAIHRRGIPITPNFPR